MQDILIKNGTIIDGTGQSQFLSDILIQNGIFTAIEPHITATSNVDVLDATDCFVAPGFIDIHSHSDFAIFANPSATNKVRQGITTEIVGNCGFSAAATNMQLLIDKIIPITIGSYPFTPDWNTMGGYFQALKALQASVNIYSLTGLGTLRASVIGYAPRAATDDEISTMGTILDESLADGALGLSAGLIYAPGCFAASQEITSLCEIVGRHNKLFVAHMRGEGPTLKIAIQEMINISKVTGVAVHISHLHAESAQHYKRFGEIMELLDNARNKEGVDITWEKYPFRNYLRTTGSLLPRGLLKMTLEVLEALASSSGSDAEILKRIPKQSADLNMFMEDSGVPQSARTPEIMRDINAILEKGMPGYDNSPFNIVPEETVIIDKEAGELTGKSLVEIQTKWGMGPLKSLIRIFIEYGADLMWSTHYESKNDFNNVIAHPITMFGTDGIVEVDQTYHPYVPPMQRAYGSYPHIIEQFVKKDNILSLEDAIQKCTLAPASRFGIVKRGQITMGYFADAVIFNLNTIKNNSHYPDIRQYPIGINMVITNGVVAESFT